MKYKELLTRFSRSSRNVQLTHFISQKILWYVYRSKTYYAHVQSEIDPQRTQLNVKLDFLCNCTKPPNRLLNCVQTYALETRNIICSTAGALTGDKLLSLAEGSIGLDLVVDFVKQVYDVDALFESSNISVDFVSDFLKSVTDLVPVECSYRNISFTVNEVLNQVIRSMEKYSYVDMQNGDKKTMALIRSFQEFYIGTSQRKPYYEWSTKALRIKYLAALACDLVNGKTSLNEVTVAIKSSKKIENTLEAVGGEDVASIKTNLLKVARSEAYTYSKLLKGKPLVRTFWQIVTPYNLEEIQKIV